MVELEQPASRAIPISSGGWWFSNAHQQLTLYVLPWKTAILEGGPSPSRIPETSGSKQLLATLILGIKQILFFFSNQNPVESFD